MKRIVELSKILCFLVFFLLSFLLSNTSSEKDITISIAAGTEECFFESLKPGQVIDIDYQVIDGTHLSFDISFYLMSPVGRTIVMDLKKPDNSHRIEVDEEGDYKFCFDNKFSLISAKTVYFELIIEAEDGSDVDTLDFGGVFSSVEEQYEVTIKDIEESVNKVKTHLLKIRHLQEAVRAFATKDIHYLEGNFFRVNSWSIIQIVVMISVGLVQVVMVKSLFDEHSKMHKVWKKTFS